MSNLASPTSLLRRVVPIVALFVFGVGSAILLFEVLFRILYLQLPYSLQMLSWGAREFGIAGDPLGSMLQGEDFHTTCVGDERLYARSLPGLDDVVVRTGPSNLWHITTTKFGFDDIGFRTPELDGQQDVVVVGDSFSYCFGVEEGDCWVRKLAEKTGLNIANLGVSGTGSISHLRYIEDYGWSLDPTLVIWQFYVNDPIDDFNHIIRNKQGCPRPDRQGESGEAKTLKEMRDWLNQTFTSYNVVIAPTLRSLFTSLADQTEAPNKYMRVLTTNGEQLLIPNALSKRELENRTIGIVLTKDAIERAADQALRRNRVLLVVIVPTNLQVYEDLLVTDISPGHASPDRELTEDFKMFLEDSGVPYIDLLPALQEGAAQGMDLYLPLDVHWSHIGNSYVADLLSDSIGRILALTPSR